MVNLNRGTFHYVPACGDVVLLDFDPQTGHEITKRRPAVVISPWRFNNRDKSLAIFCPISHSVRQTPFTVEIPDGLQVNGVVQVDQIKSLDWKARNAAFLCTVPDDTIEDILQKVGVLLEIL